MSARFLPLCPSVLALSVLFIVGGCDGSSEHSRAIADLKKRVKQLETELATLRGGAAGGASASAIAAAAKDAPGATTATDSAAGASSASPAAAAQDDPGSQPLAAKTPGIELVANSELKGSMGRIIVEFPKDAKTESTPVAVNKAGEEKGALSKYGNVTAELLPGQYELTISGARVGGAEIKARHDTRIPVGVLRITTSDPGTSVAVFSADGSQQLNSGYGSRDVGLPAGQYTVKVAGQTAKVEIKAGEVSEL
jgi:hypothetical protein